MKILVKHICLILMLSSFCSNYLLAGSAGTNVYDFLNINVDARSSALGGSVVSDPRSASSIYINPAGLGIKNSDEVKMSYNTWMEGIQHGFIGVKKGSIGAGVIYLDTGKFQGYDSNDGKIGKVKASDQAYLMGYGRSFLEERVAVGLTYKYIREKLHDKASKGDELDFGILANMLENRLNFGLCIKNLQGKKQYMSNNKKASMDRILQIGSSYNHDAITFLTQYEISNGIDGLSCGLEFNLNQKFVLRSGYAPNDLGIGLSMGFGFTKDKWSLDYAFNEFGDFGYTHIITLGMELGDKK